MFSAGISSIISALTGQQSPESTLFGGNLGEGESADDGFASAFAQAAALTSAGEQSSPAGATTPSMSSESLAPPAGATLPLAGEGLPPDALAAFTQSETLSPAAIPVEPVQTADLPAEDASPLFGAPSASDIEAKEGARDQVASVLQAKDFELSPQESLGAARASADLVAKAQPQLGTAMPVDGQSTQAAGTVEVDDQNIQTFGTSKGSLAEQAPAENKVFSTSESDNPEVAPRPILKGTGSLQTTETLRNPVALAQPEETPPQPQSGIKAFDRQTSPDGKRLPNAMSENANQLPKSNDKGVAFKAAPAQASPNQVTPNQVTPNQVTPNQVSPNQVSPNQVSPNQVSPNQVSPNQVAPNPGVSDQLASKIATAPVNSAFDDVVSSPQLSENARKTAVLGAGAFADVTHQVSPVERSDLLRSLRLQSTNTDSGTRLHAGTNPASFTESGGSADEIVLPKPDAERGPTIELAMPKMATSNSPSGNRSIPASVTSSAAGGADILEAGQVTDEFDIDAMGDEGLRIELRSQSSDAPEMPRSNTSRVAEAGSPQAQTAPSGITASTATRAPGAMNPMAEAMSDAFQVTPDTPEFPEEVMGQVKLARLNGQREIRLNLHPAELGRLTITVANEGEGTKVAFLVDNPQAREAIENSMPRLREMLAEAGLQLGDSSVAEQQAGAGGDAAGDSEQFAAKQSGRETELVSETTAEQTTRAQSDGLLDAYA